MRFSSRTVSDRLSSSIWNGGVTEGLRISTSCARTSISPERRLLFTVPAGRARTHAGHLEHELRAHAVGEREGFLAVRIADHLGEALAVAQVDEDHATVVAAPVRQPAIVTFWPISLALSSPQ
jgi:hypothetical protein